MSAHQNEIKQSIQVLCIEDSDADADLVSESLKNCSDPRYIIHRETRLVDAFEYLKTQKPDVVLLDLSLPDSYGFETVTNFLAQAPLLPMIVLTGANDKTLGIQSIKSGAQDYLVKGLTDGYLLSRIILYAIERKTNLLKLTESLEKERLAHDEAEKAIKLRDEFLSIASHEFRAPLSVLKMQMQLLIDTLQKEKNEFLLNMAKMAKRQITRFCSLVEKLFDYSQIQSGRLQLEYSTCDLNEIIKESVELLAPELKTAGCEVTFNLEKSLQSNKPIKGEWDRLRLEQVFINLLSNAIKYAPGKPLEISVSQDHEHVWILFKDNGPGIKTQDKDKMFQRFERLNQTNLVPGLGLGLYIIRQIVNAHGGSIEVESNLGVGTTFAIHLPIKPTKTAQQLINTTGK